MRQQMVEEGFILHWDNVPVHSACIITDFLATKEIMEVLSKLPPPHYSRDLALCDIFLFSQMKGKLEGEILSSDTCKKRLFGVTATLIKDDFPMAFQKRIAHH